MCAADRSSRRPLAAPSPGMAMAAPCWTRRFAMVAMSARPGTFSRLRVSAVNRLAAISGKAAFLAPLIAITPSSGTPPVMWIRSIASALRATDRPGGPGAAAGHQSAVVPPWRWFLPESGAPLKSALASAGVSSARPRACSLRRRKLSRNAAARRCSRATRAARFRGERSPFSITCRCNGTPAPLSSARSRADAQDQAWPGTALSARRPLWRIVRCLLHRFETPPHRPISDRRGGIDKVLAGL